MKITLHGSKTFLTLLALLTLSAPLTNAQSEPQVLPGSDQLFTPEFLSLVQGKKVGILAHFASRTAQGEHVVDLLAGRTDLRVKMIFSPEHGFRQLDDVRVPDSKDPVTGLPVYSLYGPRKAPTQEMLAQIDVVLIDLQDVGLRYYTYPATVAYTLEAAKLAGKPVLILDRPIPIGGEIVEGAMLDRSLSNRGLTTIAEIPTRHGMTLGEIASYLNEELKIGAELRIVPMKGWKRSMSWEETGLKWFAPSPALIDSAQVLPYASLGTLESLSLAVGRGKENSKAFRYYGAPWISEAQAEKLVSDLAGIPYAEFRTIQWTPTRATYQGKLCHGFEFRITDPSQFDSFRTLILVMKALHRNFGEKAGIRNSLGMLGASWLQDGIVKDVPTEELISRSLKDLEPFLQKRKAHLIY